MTVKLTNTQKQAIESIDKSMLVVAGAGSGKTLVLVRRFVEILQKQPDLSVHNLLAVTYTRKAAKEMRTRIKARLKELYEQAKDDETHRWHQCLADMDSAYIDTIHSLCQSILRSFTIEIGLDPQIEILDEIEKAQILQESIDETFRQVITSESVDKSLLEHFPLETIQGFLKVALDNHLRFDQIAGNLKHLSTAELIEETEKLLTRTQKQLLADLAIDEDWSKTGNYIKSNPFAEAGNKLEAIRQQVALYFENIHKLVAPLYAGQIKTEHSAADNEVSAHKGIKEAWKILLDIASLGAVRVGGNTDAAKEMRASIKMLVEKCKDYSQSKKKGYGLPLSFAASNGNDEYWQLWRALIAVARRAQNIYAAKKLELGKLDFDDLIVKTKTVLQAPNSAVRRYYNNNLAHILVDEFQDTNFIQTEIITLLAGEQTKLFLIGDDKQSIYKFQGADVSTFTAWQRKGIDSLVFEHSFRSQISIVNFVNSIFSKLLPAQQAHVDYRAKYSALKAQRETLGNLGDSGDADNSGDAQDLANMPQVEIIQLPDVTGDEEETGGTADEAGTNNNRLLTNDIADQYNRLSVNENRLSADEIEGKAVANWIFEKVKNKVLIADKNGKSREINYGDFAILAARNSDLQIFESSLSELNIPYVTFGGRTFLERQEVYDLENMLLFLSNHSNSHALLAVLRSPMFSVSDEIIHNLASSLISAANAISLWQAMLVWTAKQSSNREISQSIAEAVIVLKRLMADLPVLSLSELVYRIIRDTNYDLVALSLPDGKQRYKNIWKFYMLAKDELSAAEFAERLSLSRQLSVSETNATVDSKQAVKLMTIHAAKGLEFPAVALPSLSNTPNYNKSKLLFHDQYGIVLNTARTEEERDEGVPLPYQLGKTLDDDMDLAEKKRLLYVAMTRARDHLALFIGANGANGKNKTAASWLESVLSKLDTSSINMRVLELADLLAGTESVVEQVRIKELEKPVLQAGLTDSERVDIEKWQMAMSEIERTGKKVLERQESEIERFELIDSEMERSQKKVLGIERSEINKIEQLLEPIAISLSARDSIVPEVSLFHRITPASNNAELSPILVGKFFHRIMEYLPQNKIELQENELAALLEQFAEEAVHPVFRQALLEEGKKLLAIYAKSELQSIFSTAETICHEWSYYMNIDSEQLLLNRPDLLLESKEGQWYLIDYKTDRFLANDIEQQALRHRSQLERYGKDFRQLTSIEPKLSIYFAQSGILWNCTT